MANKSNQPRITPNFETILRLAITLTKQIEANIRLNLKKSANLVSIKNIFYIL